MFIYISTGIIFIFRVIFHFIFHFFMSFSLSSFTSFFTYITVPGGGTVVVIGASVVVLGFGFR